MSHYKQRTQKICLNCGTEVTLKYCSNCGQENREPQISIWQLITHFFNDITHFDGSFFTTLKKLVLQPGYLSLAYVNGQRVRYLDPIRMYIFTSFLFFLIFFSVSEIKQLDNGMKYGHKTMEQIDQLDSASFSQFTKQFNNGQPFSRQQFLYYTDTVRNGMVFLGSKKYSSVAEFDRLNKAGKIKDSWLNKQIIRKQIEAKQKYKGDQNAYLKSLWNDITHRFPQLLFLSLPIFAYCLKLLYIRHKDILVTDHAIYSIHLYIFSFFIMLGYLFLGWLGNIVKDDLLGWLIFATILIQFIYEYKAMRRFYQQGRLKTIGKFFLAIGLRFLIIMVLFILTIFISFLKI